MSWNVEPLDGLCDFKNGLWKGKKEPFIEVGVIRNTNFTKSGTLNDSDIAYLDVEQKQYDTRQLQFGDLILEKSGGGPKQPVGRVIVFDKQSGDFSFSNFTSVVRIKDKTKLDFSFLHKYLYFLYVTGATESMQRQSTGIRNLQLKDYKLIDVPLPPIPEQQRIVAILDQAFADIKKARANAEKNLKNARELFDSYLNQVSADKKPLGRYVTIKTGKLNSNAATENGAYPFFTCSRDIFSIDSFSFDCEAILLAGNNASGDFNVKHYCGKFDAYQRTYVITINEVNQLSYTYLYYQMIKSLRHLKSSSVGAGTKFLKIGMIENLEISIPSLAEQQRILGILEPLKENIEQLENSYKTKLKSLDELKKSLLQKAFSGELTKTEGQAA